MEERLVCMVVLNGERVWFGWATDCAYSNAGQVGEAYGEQQRQGCVRSPGLLRSCLGGMSVSMWHVMLICARNTQYASTCCMLAITNFEQGIEN